MSFRSVAEQLRPVSDTALPLRWESRSFTLTDVTLTRGLPARANVCRTRGVASRRRGARRERRVRARSPDEDAPGRVSRLHSGGSAEASS